MNLIKTALIAKGRPVRSEEAAALVDQAIPGIRPEYITRCAELSRDIGLDGNGQIGLRKWSFFDPQRLTDMAMRALMEIGQSTHFSHIVETMNVLFPNRAPFGQGYVLNTMRQDPRFVLVRRGTYGLANWGLQRPPYIRDFLASAVQSRGGTAKIDDLVAEARVKYGFRETSVRMTLSMNPRVFKISEDGTCHLSK